MKIQLFLCAMFIFAFLVNPSFAKEQDGIQMPDQIKVGDRTLYLNGMGTRKATVFNVKVYVAGLYLEAPSKIPNEILTSKQIKRMELKFLRDVSADQLTSAWKEGFEKNCKPMCKELSPYLAQMNKSMTDAKEGSLMSLTFNPDSLQIQAGNSSPTVLKNSDFSKKILAIWLGEEPPNKELKTGLLGLAEQKK
jgi:hypothetical protein